MNFSFIFFLEVLVVLILHLSKDVKYSSSLYTEYIKFSCSIAIKWSKLSTLAVDNVHLGIFCYCVNILHFQKKLNHSLAYESSL